MKFDAENGPVMAGSSRDREFFPRLIVCAQLPAGICKYIGLQFHNFTIPHNTYIHKISNFCFEQMISIAIGEHSTL